MEVSQITNSITNAICYALFKREELGDKNEPPEGAVCVMGVIHAYCFHPARLEEKREIIKEVLLQMPDNFFKGKGGGWSFLNLCMTKDGQQWGQHNNMDDLICIAMALGYASFPLPKELWPTLPGGVPYVLFDLGEENENVPQA